MPGRTIGQLAREAGVHVETIRYYERIGLIEQPETPREGWRSYGDTALRRVRFVKRAQALGLSIDDARELLALRADPARDCAEAQRVANEKIAEIDGKIRELKRLRAALQALADACPGSGPPALCPILDLLEPTAAQGIVAPA